MPHRMIARTIAEYLVWIVIVVLSTIAILVREQDTTRLQESIQEIRVKVGSIEAKVDKSDVPVE